MRPLNGSGSAVFGGITGLGEGVGTGVGVGSVSSAYAAPQLNISRAHIIVSISFFMTSLYHGPYICAIAVNVNNQDNGSVGIRFIMSSSSATLVYT